MIVQLVFQRYELSRQPLIGDGQLPQMDEGAHHIHAHLAGLRGIEHEARHHRPMLGKGQRQHLRKLQPDEVITNCDHLGYLIGVPKF